MKVNIVAAIGKNRELGKNNKLLWHIKEDFKRFKTLTSGHAIVMGRKTWESLPIKPLPNRLNIVITRDLGFKINGLREGEGFAVTSSLEEAVNVAGVIASEAKQSQIKGIALSSATPRNDDDECFIIGGAQIFQQAINIAGKLYLTIVDGKFDADTFFPDYSEFKKVIFKEKHENGEYKFTFLELEK